MACSLERVCSITAFELKLGIQDGSIVEGVRTKQGDGFGSGIEEQGVHTFPQCLPGRARFGT